MVLGAKETYHASLRKLELLPDVLAECLDGGTRHFHGDGDDKNVGSDC